MKCCIASLIRESAIETAIVEGNPNNVRDILRGIWSKGKDYFKKVLEQILEKIGPKSPAIMKINDALKSVTNGYYYLDPIGRLISRIPGKSS